jgi:cytochrome b pre-mRNA-processing protein 3
MKLLTDTRLWRLLFSPAPETYSAHALYVALSDHARNTFFYTEAQVPDTLDGRFDMHVVLVFLTLERLKRDAGTESMQRALLECFFSSLDRSLRELGVGDLGVGKRIRKMADACHGRLTRYQRDWADATTRRAAVLDNIYRADTARADTGLDALLSHLQQFEAALAAQNVTTLTSGKLAA